MVSLLFLSLVCLELFAAVSATRPLAQRTPRRYSPIKRQLDTRIAGLLVFGRQAGGPCCSNGGCCDAGEFCHGNGCCLNGQRGCLDGGCCLSDEFCDDGGCCPIGEICTGPPPGTITFGGGGGGGGGGFTPSDTSFPSTTDDFTSSIFSSHHTSFSISSGGFGGPTTFPSPAPSLPAAGSITPSSIGLGTTPIATAVSSAGNLPSASVAGAGGALSSASRAVRQPSMVIAVGVISLSGYFL